MRPPSVSIRCARRDDCARLGQLRSASISQLCGADHGHDATAIEDWAGDGSADKFLRLCDQPGTTLLVAERGGVIVGLGASTGDLVTLNYVDPAHRFTGVSKTIMAALEAGMANDGIVSARLNSTRTALAFYQACGWTRRGAPLPDGSLPMHKALFC